MSVTEVAALVTCDHAIKFSRDAQPSAGAAR
jgi:hypothetical protein